MERQHSKGIRTMDCCLGLHKEAFSHDIISTKTAQLTSVAEWIDSMVLNYK